LQQVVQELQIEKRHWRASESKGECPMLIWRGHGITTALIALAAILVVALGSDAIGLKVPYWALSAGCWVAAAAANALFTMKFGATETRKLVDPQSGEEVLFVKRHELFWIPIRYWTLIFLVFAVIAAAANWDRQ
jgi:hypothetical protein